MVSHRIVEIKQIFIKQNLRNPRNRWPAKSPNFTSQLFHTMEQDNNQEQQLNIELSEDVASGIYSNFAVITHSNSEFILDFIQVMPGVPKARVRSRIIPT